ncbi:tRNA (guanosine(46)-N7)-methyltransferase TrmB [Streptacidiphilus rugosus]|uniref:tRNA (guanosine(46)-N7)-methyltransferase TrmB n=1 Tax=Streptacidiphilus rugosus TaxID=405783 RepID=UPI000A5B4825
MSIQTTTAAPDPVDAQAAAPRPGSPFSAELHGEKRIRSFHPRKGRMSAAQHDALDRSWDAWGIRIDGKRRIDLDTWFGRTDAEVVLEIGFGMGDATATMAAAEPGRCLLAADVHTPGHGNLLRRIESDGLDNVRLAEGDAVVLLRDQLPPASLAGLRIYFPDPWPKARHHKRRLIQPDFVTLAVSRLRAGATVHCATDWEPYAEQMLEVLSGSPELENLHDGYAPRPDWRPVTKFERQGLAKGHVVHDLLFRRR